MIVWILVAVAVAILLWPSKPPALPFSLPGKPTGPDYMESVRCLQVVTQRLAATQRLNEAERKSLDAIILALASGSDE
jgi:hypothetical protein